MHRQDEKKEGSKGKSGAPGKYSSYSKHDRKKRVVRDEEEILRKKEISAAVPVDMKMAE